MSFSQRTLENAHGRGRASGNDFQVSNMSSNPRPAVENTLDATIQIIQQITQLIPIQTAKNVLIGVTSILLLFQKKMKNKDGLMNLVRRCDAICSTLARATEDTSMDDVSEVLMDALRTLESSIDELHSSVDKAMQRGPVRRFLGATLDEKQISEWTRELDSNLILFSASVNIMIVCGIRSERTYHLLKHREGKSLRPELPPAPPAMFFGRDDLCMRVKRALLDDEDVALIGPGGIGKSTIAKALIHDKDIRKHYSRRFFITYEGMDPSTITPGFFLDRIACAIGLPARGSENKHTIVSNLASSPVLMILDNAEIFEDAANRDTMEQISSIVSEIANTRGVTIILTSRTNRNARNARWTEFNVPTLQKMPARECFRAIFRGSITDEIVDELLGALDFHPLSIHILAHTAKESGWTGEDLEDEWQTQRSQLLQRGYKKENLGFTIQLSLSSPSVKDLGDDAVDILRLIAFFPQGINRKHASRLFPAVPDILLVMDTLYRVSLVYRSGTFLSTLAPIRLFLLDSSPHAELNLLSDIRQTYYDSLWDMSDAKDSHAELIISDHLNIEHLIAHDIVHGPHNTHNARSATLACEQFLWGLRQHKLRPTSLALIIPSLPEASHDEKYSKAWCLESLGSLYFSLSGYACAGVARLAATTLFVDIEDHIMAARCVSNTAMSDNNLGFFSRAQKLLEDFICSPSWNYADEEKSEINFTLDWSKVYTSHKSADDLFLHSLNDSFRGPQSYVRHWQARMYHGHSKPEEVETHLESVRSLCMSSSNTWDHWRFLQAMAEAAFLQQRFDRAMDFLDQAYDAACGDFLLTLIVVEHQAAVASIQGNYEHCRSLVQYALETLSVVSTPSDSSSEIYYVHGRNELQAQNYIEAHRLLSDAIVDSDIHGNLGVKLRSTRALGETELLLGRRADSDRSFGQTVELCRKTGIPPESLRIFEPMLNLDDNSFLGWKDFLRAQTVT